MKIINVIFCLLTGIAISLISCTPSSSLSVPDEVATANYPAKITGEVIIPNVFKTELVIDDVTNSTNRYWVVNITFTNKRYENPIINDYLGWKIATRDKEYNVDRVFINDLVPLTYLAKDKTDDVIVCFWVPADLSIDNAWLKYESRGIISYGKLTGIEKVEGYDWERKTIFSTDQS